MARLTGDSSAHAEPHCRVSFLRTTGGSDIERHAREIGGVPLARRALLVASALWVLLSAALWALHATNGLHAEYFANDHWADVPRLSVVDAEVSTALVSERWNDAPPDAFSVRWTGYVTVGRRGWYRFATTSDDGSSLSVDGRVVVNNGGMHGSRTQTGRMWLDAGSHFVLLEYFQRGGPYVIDWSWGRNGAELSRVPAWALSPRRMSYVKALAVRVLGGIRLLVSIAGALILVGLIGQRYRARERRPFSMTLRAAAACFALFVGLAIGETWPLATAPGVLSLNSNADTVLNEWVVAWVAHQAPRRPLHLFDANIFYPERGTLAYSESMLLQGALGAPLLWLGASPVLTYNLLLLAGLALTGWAMCLVLARWSRDWVAGITAGVLTAFNGHTLTRLPHLQAQHVEFLPVALFALDAVLRQPRLRPALILAGAFSLQALASFHLLIFTALALLSATLARPEAWGGRRGVRVAGYLMLAGSVAVVTLLPYVVPYWHAYHDRGLVRALEGVAGASWGDYLTTPARLDEWWSGWSERWLVHLPLFPGVVALALATVAIGTGVAFRDPRARMCLAFGVCGVVLSFGPAVPVYRWFYQVAPALGAIRAASRFAYLGLVAVAIVAAYGVAEIRQSLLAGSRWRPVVSLAIVGGVILESFAGPFSYVQFAGIPAIYNRLRDEPHAVVVELPLPPAMSTNAAAMLNSTRHWKPMLNGYSGFVPESYDRTYEALRDFPTTGSVGALASRGVTHVFVHFDRLGADALDQIQRMPRLHLMAVEGEVALYRLIPE
jgi:PA14 domain-containing protein